MDEFKYLIPEESADATSLNAQLLRNIEGKLRNIFNHHNYQELMLPAFEYADLYQTVRNEDEESMFLFVGSEGKRITLRTDFTVPIARLYNASGNGIKRYSYFGAVYRSQQRHKGRHTELYQSGIELMGLEGRKGDQECLRIIEETMLSLNMKSLKLELGSASFYHRLLELADDQRLISILKKKSVSDMKQFIASHSYSDDLNHLLSQLLLSFGTIDELKTIKSYVSDKRLLASIEELEELYEISAMKSQMIFDLAMVPTQSYYTGVMFKGYSSYSPYLILSGGRYDHLLSYFDSHTPSVGFSYHMNTLTKAVIKEREDHD
ncbi:ATP phosphoribosyltransferase regulatory subunit [Eggerthia catenaformis]|uniref:ATP phosphoribosyltransferase regulatory subunit n=2 Tax=Eggerthia catenaformis TaxID=31973 RepID=UPI00047D429C|nr:ATP phosphoribosyltransferase regulatory subunit [Eggerthia catenaformis]